jgi:pimeloyl-ACP methyl ester carboxylesterase
MNVITFKGHGGLALVAHASGDPTAPPVLLLHGGGQTRHAWAETATRLAAHGWYAVALDLRGHGESAWADDEDYSVDAFAGDVAIIAATFSQPPAVIGASLGGIAALVAQGETASSLCSALVLVDIAPRIEVAGVQRIVAFMGAHLEGFASLEEAADAIAAYLPHRPRPESLDRLAKNLRCGDGGRYYWHWDPRFLMGKRPPSASGDMDRLLRAAQTVRVPTLLVRGQLSDMVSEAGVVEFLRAVPHASYVDVSDAGHMVVGDRNDIFAAAILEFLGSLPQPR